MDWTTEVRIHFRLQVWRASGAHPASHLTDTGSHCPAAKWTEREVDNSPTHNAEVILVDEHICAFNPSISCSSYYYTNTLSHILSITVRMGNLSFSLTSTNIYDLSWIRTSDPSPWALQVTAQGACYVWKHFVFRIFKVEDSNLYSHFNSPWVYWIKTFNVSKMYSLNIRTIKCN